MGTSNFHSLHEKLEQRNSNNLSLLASYTLGKALELYQRLCEADGQRLMLDNAQIKELDVPEKLGLVGCVELLATVRSSAFQEIDNRLRARGTKTPTVSQLRDELDPPGRGLPDEVVDFLVRAY